MRVLLIEDEAAIVRYLERGLREEGHQVESAATGEDGIELAASEDVDLVIIDIGLPGLDGHQVLATIRDRKPTLPAIMLTARDDVSSKVRALDAGADDYIVKPFSFAELTARMRAAMRRGDQRRASAVEVGDLRIDFLQRRAWRGGRLIELSNREFTLLAYLMQHAGQVLTRTQLLEAVWDYDFDPGSNVVDVYIRYLRRKVDEQGRPSVIQALRGVGYRLEVPDRERATPDR
jgi:two-component system, OmpR family, response regulator